MRQRKETAAAQNTFHLKGRIISQYIHNGRNKENKYCRVVLSHAYSLKGGLGVAAIMHPKTNQHLDFQQRRQMTNRRDYKNKTFVCKRMGKTEGKKNLTLWAAQRLQGKWKGDNKRKLATRVMYVKKNKSTVATEIWAPVKQQCCSQEVTEVPPDNKKSLWTHKI